MLLHLLAPWVLLLHVIVQAQAVQYLFVVREAPYTRLCCTKSILTVNGLFPGPTIYARKGDTVVVEVCNESKYNITLHWHGVKQPNYPWSDGPEYITQCPIQPGAKFRQKIIFSMEEGTLWWHAHSEWWRATVHGAIIIYPRHGTNYPFPKPDQEVPIVLAEWWKQDIFKVYEDFVESGGPPNISDAFTINGQPGDLYPCSKPDTYKLKVSYGETILLRIINAAMNNILFFAIKHHKLTIVGTDASYTKPLTRKYILIGPGQTMDALLHADRSPNCYYMAARAYSTGTVEFDNTTTTSIIQYVRRQSCKPALPSLPYYNDTNSALNFMSSLRSLANENYPISVPRIAKTQIFSTVSLNTLPCPPRRTCEGPNGTRNAASMNNITFVLPHIDILEAYYYHIRGVFGTRFPDFPPLPFDFTSEDLSLSLMSRPGIEVKMLEYNTSVEISLQNTNLLGGIDHPMHIHGQSFYVVGMGLGNFDKEKGPNGYNLVDPPLQNTVVVPRNGWVTLRFFAHNPGVWFVHCHLERHLTWGMNTVFITKDGILPSERLLPPPPDMPPC